MLVGLFSSTSHSGGTWTSEHIVHRYAAYYSGWCVSFGEHETDYDEDRDINWLYGETGIGLILSPGLRKAWLKRLLGKREEMPRVDIHTDRVAMGDFLYSLNDARDRDGFQRIAAMARGVPILHMYLTSHFCFPKGTRIVTFSPLRPVGIIYKEIAPMALGVERGVLA